MIISRIDGGLGNQMFQYAYGLFLSHTHNTELVLDLDSYRSRPQHDYLLDRFQIDARIADSSLDSRIPSRYRSHSPWSWLQPGRLRRHKESPFGFQEKHLRVPNNRYLVGYWQSERFFPGLREVLLKHFTLRRPLSDRSRQIAQRMQQTNSVAIHVRRGDYLTNPGAKKLYHHLGLNYYLACVDDWATQQSDAEVFVFSNDMPWCRENLQLAWPTHWVDHNSLENAYEDMILMSQSACCVIANSTFSWWSAWLNTRPGKTVYAPPAWFQNGAMDDSNILCSDWRTIDTSARASAA